MLLVVGPGAGCRIVVFAAPAPVRVSAWSITTCSVNVPAGRMTVVQLAPDAPEVALLTVGYCPLPGVTVQVGPAAAVACAGGDPIPATTTADTAATTSKRRRRIRNEE